MLKWNHLCCLLMNDETIAPVSANRTDEARADFRVAGFWCRCSLHHFFKGKKLEKSGNMVTGFTVWSVVHLYSSCVFYIWWTW